MENLLIKKVDSFNEKRVLTGMIVSTRYLREIYPLISLSYFRNSYARKVAEWVCTFFDDYEKAPFKHIQDLFNKNRENLKGEEEDIIKALLVSISEKYEVEESFNVDFLLDETLLYFKKCELEIRNKNIQLLLDNNDVLGAEEQMLGMKKLSRITSNWFNPFDKKEIRKTFEEREVDFFTFPGKLGEFCGAFDQGWLVGITGPYKRGKTHLAQECAFRAVTLNIPVAFFSLEMPGGRMKERLYKRITATGDVAGPFIYPLFDCLKNQKGDCSNPQRTNGIVLLDENEKKPKYNRDMAYKACSLCRGTSEYVMDTWWEEIERPLYDPFTVMSHIEDYDKTYGKLFRMKVYPKYSANVGTHITRDLDILEQTEGFIPKMIIIDHADILAPEEQGLQGVAKEDTTWMSLAKLGGERHALVIAPTQTTGEGMEAEHVLQKHTGRWKGKLGHVDAMMTLNQTEQEYKRGIMRIGFMVHRYRQFQQTQNVTILQQLHLGQVHLDSYR